MASNSKHYGDIRIWLLKVINSCTNYKQTVTAHNLIDKFREMDIKLNYREKSNLMTELYFELEKKQHEIIYKYEK
jgi:hypothetical protein